MTNSELEPPFSAEEVL